MWSQLLQHLSPIACQFVRGFKVKTGIKKRCDDCYMVVRKGRVYNLCKTHPRHKQRQPGTQPQRPLSLAASQTHK